MTILSFLQNFSDLSSNKEVVDEKTPAPRDMPRKFPFRKDVVNISKNPYNAQEKRGFKFSKPKYNVNQMC